MWRWALAAILTAQVALGCGCLPGSAGDPSRAFEGSEVVFAGRLLETSPNLLDIDEEKLLARLKQKYGLTDAELEKLQDEHGQENPSPRYLEVWKAMMAEILPKKYHPRLQKSQTAKEVNDLLVEFAEEGIRYRFRVDEMWKGPAQGTIELRQPWTSCAKTVERDEPYLIYAYRDDKGRLSTGACSRGGPISRMGEDLAFLYHVKHNPQAAVRFSGFITSEASELDMASLVGTVHHPIPNLGIELTNADGKRATTTNSSGWFAIDGLQEGSYTLTIHSGPVRVANSRLLKGPITVSIPATGYVTQHIHIPKDLLDKK